MQKTEIYNFIGIMAAMIGAEERKKCTELGLRLVHFQVLDYLMRCNKYSNTPAATAKYLGMTRGTISQSLMILEKRSYIEKRPDTSDKRVVHLLLTPEGIKILSSIRPSALFDRAETILEENGVFLDESIFTQALTALQKANASQSFGFCKTCKHFTRIPDGFLCGLTKEKLSKSDSEKICQEHTLE
jgi:DNA-binding MarR family transcriptional regulator